MLHWLFIDIYRYFKFKEYNLCKEYGKIRINVAAGSQVFGCGKTLSLVRYAVHTFNKYDGKLVYDFKNKKFVVQHIHIISNVALTSIPYINWIGTSQFTDIDKYAFPEQDITIFLLDESGTVFNSRNFRDNISMEFLTRLLQSRKNKICLYMTSQRFGFTDKILRESCSLVTTCRKYWRIIRLSDYDAYDLENCTNPENLVPVSSYFWIATDNDFSAYDTKQLINDLVKTKDDFISDAEILNNQGENGDIRQVRHTHLKMFKHRRR